MEEAFPYESILDHPRHISFKHPQMSRHDRAAQFSPFAALTGYASVIAETARDTDTKMELDDDTKAMLDARLQFLIDHADQKPAISITYFQPDEKKDGGAYVVTRGSFKRVEEYARQVILTNGTAIPIHSIFAIEGRCFSAFEDEF